MEFMGLLFREFIFFTNFKNRMYQFLLFVQPLVYLSIFYYMSQVQGREVFSKYIIASSIISMFSYVVYSSGSSLTIQKINNTLPLLVAAPTSLFRIILAKAISNSIIGCISMLINILYAKIIFQFNITILNISLFFFSILSLVVSLIVIGLILASVFALFKSVVEYQELILTPLIILSGVFTSLNGSSKVLSFLSGFFPITWSIKSIYFSLVHIEIIISPLLISFVLSFLYLLIGILLITRIEKKLIENGNIGGV